MLNFIDSKTSQFFFNDDDVIEIQFQKAVGQEEEKSFRWHYDFHKVTLAATAVFGYAWLVPAGLYMAMWAKAENIGGGAGLITILLCRLLFAITVKLRNNVGPVTVSLCLCSSEGILRGEFERHRVI